MLTLSLNAMDNLLNSPHYDPNHLLNMLRERLQLKNDAALCRLLGVQPPLISKIRRRRLPVGAAMLLRMHEETGLSVKELRALMGDRREKFRLSPVHFKPKGRDDSTFGSLRQAA